MPMGLLGRKAGMTRVFTEAGVTVPVTVIEVLPNRVTQVKSTETDGYRAVQISFGTKRPQLLSAAVAGHYARAKVAPGRKIELHERIHRLVGGVQNVHQALVRAQLKLVARVLVTVRRD